MLKLKYKADITDIERLTKKFPEASKDAREAKITEALLLLDREITRLTPVGAGPIHLRDTIHHKVGIGMGRVWGTVGTPAIYGESVELGTKPHWPPSGPIQHWVERKLGITGKRAASVAFLIARKISKSGTKGAHMFDRGFDQNESRVMRILDQIPADIIRRVS